MRMIGSVKDNTTYTYIMKCQLYVIIYRQLYDDLEVNLMLLDAE